MRLHWILFVLVLSLCSCQFVPATPTQATTTALDTTAIATSISEGSKTPLPEPGKPPGPTGATTAAPTARVQASPTAAAAKPFILVTKDLVDTGIKPDYIIKIHYPEVSEAAAPGILAFNSEAKKLAQNLFAGFQKDFKNTPSLSDPNFSSSFAEASYTVTFGEHGLLSILFHVGFYYTGAAHPNSYLQVLNFDLIHGKRIELGDLFTPGADYLKLMSEYSITDLKKQNRLEFPEGALPKPENFLNWNITAQGLLISFDPYQVGPYAVGPSDVTIPFSVLKPLMKTGNPVEILIVQTNK